MKNPPRSEPVKKRKQFVVHGSLNASGLNARAFRFFLSTTLEELEGFNIMSDLISFLEPVAA